MSTSLIAEVDGQRQPLSEHFSTLPDDSRLALYYHLMEEQKLGWLLTTFDSKEAPDYILKVLKEHSVVYNLDANYPHTYLIHGLADKVVPFSHSAEMAAELKKHNVTHEIGLVPDVDHIFDFKNVTPETWQNHITPIFDFIKKHITNPSVYGTTKHPKK